MFKKMLTVLGAMLLFGIALLCQTLDAAPHAAPAAATCTAGIRGVAGLEASA